MKILYVVHGFPPSIGAGSINAHKITEYLVKFGHEVLVLTPGVFSKTSDKKREDFIINSNMQVHYSSPLIKIPLNLVFSHIENLVRYLVKLKPFFSPDIVLSQYQAFHFAPVIGSYLSKILKVPHVIRSHDIFFMANEFSLPFKLMHRFIYGSIYKSIQRSDIFYVNTSEMRRYFLSFKKLRNIEFKIHPNGIDNKMFYPSNNQDVLKNKYNCENILLFIGTLAKDYGLHNLITILPEILKTHSDTHLVIVGEGAYRKEINQFVKENNLDNQVHLLGIKRHEEIPFFINNCDIGIGLLSDKNHFRYVIPVKCLEYMACKKSFITSSCSTDLIKGEDVGLLLKKNFSKKEMVDKLTTLIEDKNLQRTLGESGFKKVNEKFLWEDVMKKLNKEISNLL